MAVTSEHTLEQARDLFRTIRRLQMLIVSQQAAIEENPDAIDLTPSQMGTLMAIQDGGQMSLKAIAEATQVSAPSASTMVEKLQEMGLLTRNHAENDRRSVEIVITDKGLAALNFTENCLLQGLVEILDGIGPEWASNWCDVYRKINAYLDGLESSP